MDSSLRETFKHPAVFIHTRSCNMANNSGLVKEKKQAFIKGCYPCRHCFENCELE